MSKPFRLMIALLLSVTGMMSIISSPVAAESGVVGPPDYGFAIAVPNGAIVSDLTSLSASIGDGYVCEGGTPRFIMGLDGNDNGIYDEGEQILYITFSTSGTANDCVYADGTDLVASGDTVFSDGASYFTFPQIVETFGGSTVTFLSLISEQGVAEATATATWSTVVEPVILPISLNLVDAATGEQVASDTPVTVTCGGVTVVDGPYNGGGYIGDVYAGALCDVTVPAGTYEAVYQVYGPIEAEYTLYAELTAVVAPEEPVEEAGTLEIVKWYCDVETVETDGIIGDDCVHGNAVFTIYLYGDGTDAHVQVETGDDGNVVVELLAGDYEVVEESTQTHIDVTIVAGENRVLSVENPIGTAPEPGDDDAETPAPGDTGDAAVPGADDDTVKADDDKKDKDAEEAVTKLPATGVGSDEGTDALMLAAAVASALAGAGAIVVQRKR